MAEADTRIHRLPSDASEDLVARTVQRADGIEARICPVSTYAVIVIAKPRNAGPVEAGPGTAVHCLAADAFGRAAVYRVSVCNPGGSAPCEEAGEEGGDERWPAGVRREPEP